MAESAQSTLALDLDSPEAIESKAMILLREYRTIDADIALYESLAKGDGLIIQPSSTHALGEDEDDKTVRKILDSLMSSLGDQQNERKEDEAHAEDENENPWDGEYEPYSEGEIRNISVLKRYLSSDELRSVFRKSNGSILPDGHEYYASGLRVRALLSNVNVQSTEDQEILDGVCKRLDERLGDVEEAVHLTSTEQLAIRRWKEIENARDTLAKLRMNRDAVRSTLSMMDSWWTDEAKLLRLKYVEDRSWYEVMSTLHISEHMYVDLRKRAMTRFISRVGEGRLMSLQTGLLDKSPYRKRGPRAK